VKGRETGDLAEDLEGRVLVQVLLHADEVLENPQATGIVPPFEESPCFVDHGFSIADFDEGVLTVLADRRRVAARRTRPASDAGVLAVAHGG